jgi:hypothetical protein
MKGTHMKDQKFEVTIKFNLEAFQRAAVSAGKAAENFKRAMATLAEACRRKPRPQLVIPPHAFWVGNFDLTCRLCGRGPEECGR